jgi:hypothetical protein
MSMLSRPSFGPRVALIYVTLGSLIALWTGVYWWFKVSGDAGTSENTKFWLIGFFLTGMVLIFIGLIIGPLGQQARKAELPPSEAIHKEQAVQQTAAAVPNVAVPGMMAPGMPVPGPVAPGYPAPAQAAPPAPPAYPAARSV